MKLARKVRAVRGILGPGLQPILFALTGGATLSICLIVGSVLKDSYLDIGHDVAVSASNLAVATAHDVDRNIELVDRTILAMSTMWTKPEIQALSPMVRDMVLFHQCTIVSEMAHLVVVDEHGNVQTTSIRFGSPTKFLGNLDYFRVHIASDVGLYVSKPFVSAVTHQWLVALSRRITRADGSFGGIVLGTINLAHLNQLYESLNLGRDGSVTLFRTDGTIVARAPYADGDARRFLGAADGFASIRSMQAGSIRGASPVDGKERIISFHRVGKLPLIQDVEISTDEAYNGWWRKTILIGCVLGVMCLSSLALLVMLNAELSRRVATEAELARLARTDELTGLSNRRRFVEDLETRWTNAMQGGSVVSLLMIDADKFKAFNDALGHLAGDRLLKSFAVCLLEIANRPGALACRYGGEEFVVLLPGIDAPEAFEIAEHIRTAIMSLARPHPGSAEMVATVSIGIASMRPTRGEDSDRLVAAADAALYRAKTDGRNRCRIGQTAERPGCLQAA